MPYPDGEPTSPERIAEALTLLRKAFDIGDYEQDWQITCTPGHAKLTRRNGRDLAEQLQDK